MNLLDQKIFEPFLKVARAHSLEFQQTPNRLEILGIAVSLHIKVEVERIQGVFVTLARRIPNQNGEAPEYGIAYLVEFEGNKSQAELDNAVSDNPELLAKLVERYAMPYLRDGGENFDAFAQFAAARVKAHLPALPEIKANRRIRPEWNDNSDHSKG